MLRLASAAALICASAVAACGGSSDRPAGAIPEPTRVLKGAEAHAPAPVTSGTLSHVPDTDETRARLGYVNLETLAQADLPVAAADVRARILGVRGADALDGRGGQRTAVRVGAGTTVLHRADGEPEVLGARPAQEERLRETAPETSAITPAAQSAAQSCLGDTLAQTILGPATMGDDAALGVGLAESGDEPAGLQLRICGAPKYIRHIHAMERALKRRFKGVEAVIGENEIGEREIAFGTIAADELEPAELLALLGAGRELRSLAWHKKATRP